MSPIFIGPQSSSRTSTPAMAYRTPLLNGEQGTAQTIALMRQLVDDALAESVLSSAKRSTSSARFRPSKSPAEMRETAACAETVQQTFRNTRGLSTL